MRILAISQIWPNSIEPLSSPFNVQQFRALKRDCDLSVLAAIPYVPGAKFVGLPPRASQLASLPSNEKIAGIETHYVRQLYIPKVGVPVAVPLYLASLTPYLQYVRAADVLLGTWAYPDGCSAILLARAFGKPCVVKVHGSDINIVAKMPSARSILRKVLPLADGVVSVSTPLSSELEQLGAPRDKIHLVPNGVDSSLFAPRDRDDARRSLGVSERGPMVLFVGRLEPQKGLDELLEAWREVKRERPEAILALVGEGVSRAKVNEFAREVPNVYAPGAVKLTQVAEWMGACNVFTLPSWNEGTPNVVLEALASGRPAVGTAVGGIPDALSDPRSGYVVPPRDPTSLARALIRAIDREWNVEDVRACGPGTWEDSARLLRKALDQAIEGRGSNRV